MARRLVGTAFATVLVAGLTVLIFLIRAGDPGGSNWPVEFDLGSSDNGVLFQFAQDVFTGRSLDWSFSPQVFVFPEIPISLLSFALAGGSVQWYFLVVAVINNSLLFLAMLAGVRYLYPADAPVLRIARAGIGIAPLLLLPLLGSTWLFEYHLAPTYYFGMYLLVIAAPGMLVCRSRWARALVAIAVALTAASNPLALVFTVPALACVLLVRGITLGIRSVWGPGAWAGGTIAVALLLRFVLFARLEGGSPFAYVSTTIFSGRVQVLGSYLRSLFETPATAVVVVAGAVLAVAGLFFAAHAARQLVSRRRSYTPQVAVAIYYALVPVTGLAGTAVLLITDYLYLWPVLVLPLVLVLLPIPNVWMPWAAAVAASSLIVAGAVTGGVINLGKTGAYFDYRSAETRCLDAKLPAGMTVGYATFSDARRIELTSNRGIRLIQLKSSGVRAYWLTNRDYDRDAVGQFFYINQHGDESAIDVRYLTRRFGSPDASFTCGPGEAVLIYTAPSKLAAIRARYSTPPPP